MFPVVQRRLEPGDLIRVGKQVFEILGYIHEHRLYWVRSFSTELSEEDLRRLAGD